MWNVLEVIRKRVFSDICGSTFGLWTLCRKWKGIKIRRAVGVRDLIRIHWE